MSCVEGLCHSVSLLAVAALSPLGRPFPVTGLQLGWFIPATGACTVALHGDIVAAGIFNFSFSFQLLRYASVALVRRSPAPLVAPGLIGAYRVGMWFTLDVQFIDAAAVSISTSNCPCFKFRLVPAAL